MSVTLPYAVVFEGIDPTNGYKGVRTWTAFRNKKHFKQWLNHPDNHVLERERVLIQGVTDEEATQIVMHTSPESYAAACIAAATDGEGHIHQEALYCEATNVGLALSLKGGDSAAFMAALEKLLRSTKRSFV